jgi:penicillin-binding protein 2
MAKVATDLGLGAPTGLGLNSEVPGLVPSMDYYKRLPGGFQKGVLLNTAIGQGDTKVTVLQLAMAYAAIANGGKLWVPQIVERVQTAAGQPIQDFPPRLRRQISASADTLQKVRAALYDAVNHGPPHEGTSWRARVPGLDVAGKTGTAQTGKFHKEGEEGDENNSHSWFASFAPSKDPKIAVVVLIEHGGFGAKASTPTAMEIYQGYFAQHPDENKTHQARRSPTPPPSPQSPPLVQH